MIEAIVSLLVVMGILGVLYWVSTKLPLPPLGRTACDIIFGVICLCVVLAFFGIVPGWHVPAVHLPK